MVNNTVIDWFTPWPEDALRSVSEVFLRDLDMPDEFRETITEHMVLTHQSVRDYSVKFYDEGEEITVMARMYSNVDPAINDALGFTTGLDLGDRA